ncbi:MAG: efflux RND transporter periplasmic adaptor subunit [Dysgonamonadaceae bacterium]|jgi:RND family efflux transporter MFP subunit|nr:efflux RND transporter periplasmic adaptor subunit [Dysgonamonadaceae bacterium]
MKKIFFLLAFYSLFMISCGHKHTQDEHNHEHGHEHAEAEAEADHDGNEHEHEGEQHEHSEECTHDHDHEEDSHDHENVSGAISFTKVQASKIDFSVDNPLFEPSGQVIRTTARIVSDQTDESIVVARTSGIVLFSGNNIVEGKSVTSGQVLFYVSGSGMADNNMNVRLAEAQSTYAKAEADYSRSQELAKDKIVSDKELRRIRSEYESAKAIYDNLYKNFSEKGQRVSCPTGGFVKQLYVSNGQYVEAGQALVSVSGNRSLLLRADVPARYAPLLPHIISANIRKPNDTTVYTLSDLNGKVLSFGRSVNDDNYLLPVTFQIDNKAGFISGSFVEIFIKAQSGKPVLSISKNAIVENQGAYFVFVQVTPEAYEKREVKIGVSDGIRTEIISGLTINDKIVSKGAISVKLAESSGALDPHAGHVH